MFKEITILAVIVAICMGEAALSGPYPPSGWKPQGAPFTLPKEFLPQQQGQLQQGQNTEVEVTQERVDYAGQLTETTTQYPTNSYLPPQVDDDNDDDQENSTDDFLKVQGLPSPNQARDFNEQSGQLNREYGAPSNQQQGRQLNREYGAPSNQQQGRELNREYGAPSNQQQGRQLNREYGAPSNQQQGRQLNREYGAPSNQQQGRELNREYGAPSNQQQGRQLTREYGAPSNQQQGRELNREYGAPPATQNQYRVQNNRQFGQVRQQQQPKDQVDQSPQPAEFGQNSQRQQVQTPGRNNVPATQYGPPDNNNSTEENENNSEEEDGPTIAISNSVSNGRYYILTPDNTLQRVLFMTSQNEDEAKINGFTAELRYMPVEPIRDPIYAYNDDGQLIRIYNKK